MVWDRWRWLKKRLPVTRNNEVLIDVGCGSGAFSIGASLRGYRSLGLSWDERNQGVAAERSEICGAKARFDVLDVRHLDSRTDLVGTADYVVCFENIEHIIDDVKLVRDMAACLKPGGRLLLSAPFVHFRPMGLSDAGPWQEVEDGAHVRRGYSPAMLQELCARAGLVVESIGGCSGCISQILTRCLRTLARIHPFLGWAIITPLRPLALLDGLVHPLSGWPHYSITLEAYKGRFR
jgi:SAM-dependent methyltransferase